MADTAPAPTRSTAPAPDTTRKARAEGVGTAVPLGARVHIINAVSGG